MESPSQNEINRALLQASSFNKNEKVKDLLAKGADINAFDGHHMTALHYAAINGHLEIARTLLDAGADPNARDINKSTPLHFTVNAIKPTAVDMARLLLEAGANPELQDHDGDTAASFARSVRKIELAETIEQHQSRAKTARNHEAARDRLIKNLEKIDRFLSARRPRL